MDTDCDVRNRGISSLMELFRKTGKASIEDWNRVHQDVWYDPIADQLITIGVFEQEDPEWIFICEL
jgi:hypothetical protein